MKKVIVILCIKLYNLFPDDTGGWLYYHDVLDKFISPASEGGKMPRWYKPWMYKIENLLFTYIKKNKDIAKEYHRAVIKKKNENSKDGTVYV